jgi:hypothetical protein
MEIIQDRIHPYPLDDKGDELVKEMPSISW